VTYNTSLRPDADGVPVILTFDIIPAMQYPLSELTALVKKKIEEEPSSHHEKYQQNTGAALRHTESFVSERKMINRTHGRYFRWDPSNTYACGLVSQKGEAMGEQESVHTLSLHNPNASTK